MRKDREGKKDDSSVRTEMSDEAMSDCSLITVETRPRSESESSGNASGAASGRLWKGPKRPRLGEFDVQLSMSSDEEMKDASSPTRGRGRPPTTGKYVGLAKAREALNRAKKEEMRLQVEQDLLRTSLTSRFRREKQRSIEREIGPMTDDMSAAQIQKRALDEVALISSIATKSTNLKGTFVRELKNAASSIKEAVEVLSSRTISDETRQLQADNARLQAEMASLRKELATLRSDLEKSRKQGPASSPPDTTEGLRPDPQLAQSKARTEVPNSLPSVMEEVCRTVLTQVGTMLNARLAALEDRLLPEKRIRPPLAADKRKATRQPASYADATRVPGPSQPAEEGRHATETPPARPASQPAAAKRPTDLSAPKEAQWQKVSQKRAKKKDKGGSQSQPQKTQRGGGPGTAKSGPKLRPPRSSAVVLTLQSEAEKRGASYAGVLAEARQKIALSDLGITSLRFRKAATGGRILELPGASSAEKADALALRLKEVVSEEIARVSRPVKCADMRITGLDDSVSKGDVAGAVAKVGGCPPEQVLAGEIRQDAGGLGTVWLRCPVAAAKKVLEGGRLLVGWVSAQVKVLDERPQRCYRCLEFGHMRALCTAEIDRSDTCYRCSQTGHKARGCTAVPHCSVCAAAGRVANHRGGSSACIKRSKKRGGRMTGDGPRVPSQPARPSTNAQASGGAKEVPMTEG
ncbi:uncharacterized protein LOC120634778 [Pararge aegeria]|uniref:uncharacterized protein LOC120634778 n=1 Tax=Pararge aegeria TaxID=116150 RepID=UPI0019D08D8C|nr:uncharacterized protein LOC120634778 [Pararge aegeria]